MSLMDVARGAYARSPNLVRRSLSPFVSLLPTRTKFGPTYRLWRERIALSHSNPAIAAEAHLKNLRSLMRRAHADSPFYRDLLDQTYGARFDYGTMTPELLRQLPVLTKCELRKAGDATLTVPKSQADLGDTSGSNGERPFVFYLDKDRSAREMAFVYDGWSRTGISEADAKIVLRGFGFKGRPQRTSEWEPAFKELRLSVFPMSVKDVSHYIDQIDRYRVRYLYGYPSAIELMCRHLLTLGRRPRLPLLGILPISEPLFSHQRKIIEDVFGPIPIAQFYGLSEKTLFATDLMDGSDIYQFDPLYGLAELVDAEGQTITEPGREGRVIGTGFLSTAMPFIRYDTEDLARLVRPATAENGYRLQVDHLIPRRKPNFLISRENRRVVTIDFTPDSPRYFSGIDEYQFYQDQPGFSTIRYIPTPDGTPADAQRVAEDLTSRTHGSIQFTVERVERLAGGRAGKRAFIDQRLDISRY